MIQFTLLSESLEAVGLFKEPVEWSQTKYCIKPITLGNMHHNLQINNTPLIRRIMGTYKNSFPNESVGTFLLFYNNFH